jgi:type 1 glutamine amidotransferase
VRLIFSAFTLLAASTPAWADEPIRALLLTGQNNHNWPFTSRVHEETLEATGRFAVDVADDPAAALADAGALKGYSVFVLDYNGRRWGDAAEANFLARVREGAGVVIIHAANNAFVGWKEYEQLCGLMWINGTTGHGKFHSFDVSWVDAAHPILSGMPEIKSHSDELYHKLVNTQKSEFKTLAQALSTTESGGTGNHEPMAMTLAFGRGRIFHTPLGHVWKGDDASKVSVVDPQFRILVARGAEWAANGTVTIGSTWQDGRTHNVLTLREKLEGWTSLFDGKTGKGWHGFKMQAFPENWEAAAGVLRRKEGKNGPDLVTDAEYADFEFAYDWKVGPGGNSGVMYRCSEEKQYPWQTGPEMQVLDDARHADGKKPKTRAGTLYDVIACSADVCRPAGEWNSARIVARGTKIEHWLNGFKVVDTDTVGDEYRAALAQSKWAKSTDYNSLKRGRIALQDHGDPVEYRNLKVRDLSGK